MQITIRKADDFHLHLRDNNALTRTVTDAAKQFSRAIVMPNLVPPVMNLKSALEYRQRILAAIPKGLHFTPLMTLYLTNNTTPKIIAEAVASESIYACKLYPQGATTHSDSGVSQITNIKKTLEKMQELGLPLLIHGEVTEPSVDIFDREKVFIERTLTPLLQQYPALKVVLEHITTKDAVEFVSGSKSTIAATITAHHLLMNRNDLFVGGIKPHHYCLPILKRKQHQQALIKAATSGSPKFFLGTDSAPHSVMNKESACGCAGIYTAYCALELYAEAFEKADALDKLEVFTSENGANFYGLPKNKGSITLIKDTWKMPESLEFAGEKLIPFRNGQDIHWKLVPTP